jgi:hypothetical protein
MPITKRLQEPAASYSELLNACRLVIALGRVGDLLDQLGAAGWCSRRCHRRQRAGVLKRAAAEELWHGWAQCQAMHAICLSVETTEMLRRPSSGFRQDSQIHVEGEWMEMRPKDMGAAAALKLLAFDHPGIASGWSYSTRPRHTRT